MMPPVNLNEYKRLEFLGDRVLNLIVSRYLYEKFPDHSEGDLTKKLRFTSNENLDEIVERFNGEFKTELTIFKRNYKPDDPELSADDVEAFIGKYYLDYKFEASKKYLEEILAKEIDAFDPRTDYISILQEYTQKKKKNLPVYEPFDEKMVHNNMHEFRVPVFIDGEFFGEGIGCSKSKAKKLAAYKAIKKLEEVGEL